MCSPSFVNAIARRRSAGGFVVALSGSSFLEVTMLDELAFYASPGRFTSDITAPEIAEGLLNG